MTIKKLNVEMFETIVENKQVEEESFELTTEQAEALYDSGMSELNSNAFLFNSLISEINDSSLGFVFLQTPEFEEFFDVMNYYISFLIPLLLKGDFDSIIKESLKEVEQENEELKQTLECLRILLYQELAKKYL